ncbi:MAG: hypothetical protein ACTSU6_01355 [Candidatus Njordarchaeales archaeon]
MRVLNFKAYKFAVGKQVKIISEYVINGTVLQVGEIGKIIKYETHSYPDIGLFGIKVIRFVFGTREVAMGQSIAELYMEVL